MKTDLFSFHDYKAYLKRVGEVRDRLERGFRSQLSRALKVQTAYVSQVLNAQAHLSLEQAEAVNGFLHHDEQESEFFFLMVQHARAGTVTLKRYFKAKMDLALKTRQKLGDRIRVQKTLSAEHQATYYSSWVYAAIHMLVTIPAFQTRPALESKVKIPKRKLSEVLQFLVAAGLLRKKGDQYSAGEKQIHLGQDSPLLAKHQQNWRLRAVEQIELGQSDESVHFSGVITLSRFDAERIKERLRKEISECMKIVQPSLEEELYALNIDLFEAISQ